MNADTLDSCRARVGKLLGEDAAKKATVGFCLAFGTRDTLPRRLRAIIDLEPEAWPLPPFDEAVARMRASATAQGTVELAYAAFGELGDERLARRAETLLNPADLLRELYIREIRERRYEVAGPIRYELERHVPDAALARASSSTPTRICWLNHSLRTWTDPHALAAVAADRNVKRIDIPRRLRPEIGRTGEVVGAVAHRANHGHTGRRVIVAVIDGEVDKAHPALQGRVVHVENFTREPWGHPGAHGTAVAGIIAAQGDLLGIAPDATIHNYKVFMTDHVNQAEDFDGAIALEHALQNGAKIANCSWGTPALTDGQSREVLACNTAWQCGLTVVKSAGNEGRKKGSLTSPADADGVIVVGATDREGRGVQPYSSRGPTINGKKPHVVAPGGIRGKHQRGIDSCLGNGFGDCGWGTSLAAPHVTGILAVLLEMRPGLTPDQQRQQLLELCTSLPPNDEDVRGKGLVSLANLK